MNERRRRRPASGSRRREGDRAARQLAVPPPRCAGIEDATAGVAAARAGGFRLVVGDAGGTALLAHGADLVVRALTELLEGHARRSGD